MDRREDVKGYYPDACGKDKREDSGNYYPGGTVVPQGKVPSGQENFVQKQEGLEVKTNTIADLREAVKDLAKAMGATVVSVFAAMVAFSAEVQTAKLGEIELDTGSVVTNVVLDGVATTADLDDKRGKTDLTVYEADHTARVAAECFPIVIYGETITSERVRLDQIDPGGDYHLAIGNYAGYCSFSADGLFAYGDSSVTYGGRKPVVGEWPRLEFMATITPTADTLATTSTVAKVVSLVVTNSVKTGEFTPWTFSLPGDYSVTEEFVAEGINRFWQYVLLSSGVGIGGIGQDERMTAIDWGDYVPGLLSTRSEISTNALGIAFVGDVEKKLGEIDAESIGAFPAADGRQLAAQVSAQGAYLNAEDARFVSTNYDSKVRFPEAYFEIKLPSGEWARMWSEMTRWNWFLEGIYSPFTNSTATALATKGEKEWGFFDAATGAPAPDGFLWASMPRIAICAGAAYQRIADADGAYWVLESNGMVAEINGSTNGFFRIVDDEGKAQFEIVKGDKRTLFAAPGSMVSSVMGITHYHTTYSITNAVEAPVAQFSRSISEPQWLDETDAACPANVSWTKKDSSTYICEWWPKSAEPSLFMRAAFAVGGETRIIQTAPVEMQRIVIGGETYRITVSEINGKKVLTLDE